MKKRLGRRPWSPTGREPHEDRIHGKPRRGEDHTPPSFHGTRDTSGTFQAAIDALIDEFLGSMAIPHPRLDPEDREGWVDVVIRTVGLLLQPPQIDFFS